MTRRRARSRTGQPGARGFVLLAVLVVVAAAILVATGAIFTARATTAGARASTSDARLREAALDGVALVADRIARERASVLRGASPEIDERVLTRDEGDGSIEVTLVPLAGGEVVESEGAKLDANLVDPATLARVADGLGPEVAEVASALGGARPVASLDGAVASLPEAARLRALRAVLGPLRTIDVERDRTAFDAEPCLVALLGVHAREALVSNDGAPRLDVVAALGDEAESALPAAALARFDDAEVEALRKAAEELAKSGTSGVPDDGRLASALLARGIAPDRIDAILDGCTLHSGALGPARLDLVRADRRALAALDGLGAEAADRIVELRTTLEPAEREGTSWLVSRRVLAPDAYARVAGRITHRSTAWRFRVVARHADEGGSEDLGPAATRAGGAIAGGPVAAFDCIVDVSGESPRLVMLRDVGMLPTARALALALVERAAERDSVAAESVDASAAAEAGTIGDADDLDLATMGPDPFDFDADLGEVEDVRASEPRAIFPGPATPTVESTVGSATMHLPRHAPSRPRTDPTGRDVGSGAGTGR